MSELSTRMNLIKTLLAAAYPLRVVTRDMLDFTQRDHADLEKGIWTLVSIDERDYKNYSGREGMDGVQSISLVGQLVKPEGTLGSVIEDAELAMVDEIKDFLRARPAQIIQLYMTGFRQSGQLDAPYGWVVIDLEFLQ